MLNKIFYSVISLFCLSGCITQTPPNTAQPKQYNATLLVGKWYCETPKNRRTTFSIHTTYHENGTAESQIIVKKYLTDNLAWRFGVSSQTQWRIEGEHYFEKYTARPQAKILPAENQSEESALKLFEQNNPEIAKLKTENLNIFSQFHDREVTSKIIQLDKQSFISELDLEVGIIRMTCQRIGNSE